MTPENKHARIKVQADIFDMFFGGGGFGTCIGIGFLGSEDAAGSDGKAAGKRKKGTALHARSSGKTKAAPGAALGG